MTPSHVLVGHCPCSETPCGLRSAGVHYNAAGKSIAKLAEYVDRIRLDISGIRRPFATVQPQPMPLRLVRG
jgi:hypothetical protein